MRNCRCIGCGRSMAEDDLRFDLTDLIADNLDKRFSGDVSVLAALNALKERWSSKHLGPTMIPEKALVEWTHYEGFSPVRLNLPLSRWLSLLRSWQDGDGLFQEESTSGAAAGITPFDDFAPLSPVLSESASILAEAIERTTERAPETLLLEEQLYPNQNSCHGAVRILEFDVFRPNSKTPYSFRDRYCPHCGNLLEPFKETNRETLVLVFGGDKAGKSSAISACADYFLPRLRAEKSRAETEFCKIQWGPYRKRGLWEPFEKDFLSVYRKGESAFPAEPVRIETRILLPRTENSGEESLNLMIAEFPLKALAETSDGVLWEQSRNFCRNADFLWLCVDSRIFRPPDADSSGVLEEYMEFLRGYREMVPPPERPPAVFLLTKSDEIQKDVLSGGQIPLFYSEKYRLSERYGGIQSGQTGLPFIQMEDYYANAYSLRHYIRTKMREAGHDDAHDLIACFEEVFRERTYIAVSAFGFAPDKERRAPRSCRAEWPFLWALALRGDLMVRSDDMEGFALSETYENRKGAKETAESVIRDNLGMSGKSSVNCQSLVRFASPDSFERVKNAPPRKTRRPEKNAR